MTSGKHRPGHLCDVCEGFCLQPVAERINAGVDIGLRLGQRVAHGEFHGRRVTGVVWGLSFDSDARLSAHILLDAPIVIPAMNDADREVSVWHQHVPAHELKPFDERDELIEEMLAALKAEDEWRRREQDGAIDPEWDYEQMVGIRRRAAIARVTGVPA